MKKTAILYSEYKPVIDAIKFALDGHEINCLTKIGDMLQYDLVINLCPEKFDIEGITCHHSLLPAFCCKDPEKEALLNGVKVTGITIYYKKSGKILAQYPIFIKTDTHYEELRQELDYLEQAILPVVVKKVADNEQFEISSLTSGGCSGNCGGCASCRH